MIPREDSNSDGEGGGCQKGGSGVDSASRGGAAGGCDDDDDRCSSRPRDVFLSSEERYEIWAVKASERPELLERYDEEEEGGGQGQQRAPGDDGEEAQPDLEPEEPALSDGCDIPGWRSAGLVKLTAGAPRRSCKAGGGECDDDNGGGEDQEGDGSYCSGDGCGFVASALHVGQGCALMRRESQLPMLPRSSLEGWERLRCRFSAPVSDPSRLPRRVRYRNDDGSFALPVNPWFERQNVPVVIDGCTDDWEAMESCTFRKLVERFGHLQWRFSDTHGETTSLRTYAKYVKSLDGGLADDAPLGVYDSQFADGGGGDERSKILNEYSVPSCFREDLFESLHGGDASSDTDADSDEDDDDRDDRDDLCHRPPYRWILIGPGRSGTVGSLEFVLFATVEPYLPFFVTLRRARRILMPIYCVLPFFAFICTRRAYTSIQSVPMRG